MPKPYLFMGVCMRISNRQETLQAIKQATSESPVRIATFNGEFFLKAAKLPAFKKALEQMTHCTIDGSGPFFMLKRWTKQNKQPEFDWYPGANMVAELFKQYQDGSKTFYLLGGEPEVAVKAAKAIQVAYPGVHIGGAESGGIIRLENPIENSAVINRIAQAKPDILLVAFGAPKQELWIQAAASMLNIPAMIGVGGTLNFYVNKKRAHPLLRKLHLEWLGRMLLEPGHYRRVWQAVIIFPLQAWWWMIRNK